MALVVIHGVPGLRTRPSCRDGQCGCAAHARPQGRRHREITGRGDRPFAVAEGTYRVDLGFAEIVAKKTRARVFSVTIEGQTVVANLDVLAKAGGRNTALDRSFLVTVTDGTLDIGFTAQRGDAPIVNAILVTKVPEGSPDW